MATTVLKDASINVASTDLSAQVVSITLNYAAEELDDTAMGMNTRSNYGGLKTWDASIEIKWTAAIDSAMFAAIGTQVTFVGKPSSGSVSSSNPSYTGTGLLVSTQPIQGRVGEIAMITLSLKSAGDLARATT